MTELKCPSCNGSNIVKAGHLKSGKQRYKCQDCNRRFILDPQVVFYARHEKKCPICGHPYAKKAGTTRGKQYYLCLKCNHKFLEGGVYRWSTSEDKNRIIELYKEGCSRMQIVEQTGFSIRTVYNVLKESGELKEELKIPKGEKRKEVIQSMLSGEGVSDVAKRVGVETKDIHDLMRNVYPFEELSQEQKALLYKYGIECNVPAPYLAPYVHCSQRTCKKFLKKYKKPNLKRAKIELTQKEKDADRMILDRFIR